MPKMKDITDQRFGKLVAVRPTENRINRSIAWECQCDCGHIAIVATNRLVSGHIQSCGCIVKGKKAKDLNGHRFGKLIPIRPIEKRINGSVAWECQCDCGNTVIVATNRLVSGHTKSCGCSRNCRNTQGLSSH